MLDFKTILEKYPKALDKICDYYRVQKDIQEAIHEVGIKEDQKDNFIKAMVQTYTKKDPRKLYDAFDHLGVYISVGYSESQDAFIYYINHSDSVSTDSRKLAEDSAFMDAFKLLEKQ